MQNRASTFVARDTAGPSMPTIYAFLEKMSYSHAASRFKYAERATMMPHANFGLPRQLDSPP